MSGSEKLDFHFIDLKGEITGQGENPASASDHHSLSINRASVNKLIATRESSNTGAPLPATLPLPADAPATREETLPRSDDQVSAMETREPTPPDLKAMAAEIGEATREQEADDLPQRQAVESPNGAHEAPAVTVAEKQAETWQGPHTFISGLILGADFSLPSSPSVESRVPDAAPDIPEEAPEAVAADAGNHEAAPATASESETQLEPGDILKLSADLTAAAQPEPRAAAAEPGPKSQEGPEKEQQRLPQPSLSTSLASATDNVLNDVQSTLKSLADMATGLAQQKLEAVKQQESLDQRKLQLHEKERLLADKEEQLRLLEARLTREVSNLERNAEDNARALAERSAALKALAENVEARDRSTAKFAETLRLEKQRNDELTETLARRAEALDERDAALNRKDEELAEKLKQLIGAKDRFRALVKAFNETVQFNNTLNAISSTTLDDTAR
ncbi:hypothetical protein ACFPU0_22125 [Pseudomonas sp. GCM10022186]|uniref:hypothetical protein n=1 Tax=Pseudomonas sp. GCM10022186 TaxID=3252650 RepID=UPI0036134BFB